MGTGGQHTIQGHIYFPSGRRADARIKIKLESTNAGEVSTIADTNGTFTFRNLEAGSYTVIVESDDYETARESVLIEEAKSRAVRNLDTTPRNFVVPIYLQPKPTKNSSETKPGVLNAALANVPQPAQEQYNHALESIKAGETRKAIEQLKTALSYYPSFTLALNELGVQYLKLGQADSAIESLRAALRIEPEAITPRLNYGVALLEKKNFSEAEAQLRQVLKGNEAIATAHLYLGITLISLRQYDNAEKELQRAAALGRDSMSLAHYYLGGIYWKKKEYKLAADELETYLKLAPKAQDAERIRATIKEMRSKQNG